MLIALGASPVFAKDAPPDFRAVALPAGWTETVVEHAQATVQDIGSRLGFPLKRVTMRQISIHGLRADVNVVTLHDETTANRLVDRLVQMRGADFVRRAGTEVIEVARTDQVLVAARILAWLGVEGGATAIYDVKASLGLVDPAKHDYMEANPVFNHFLMIDQGKEVETATAAVREAVKDWGAGDALSLFTGPRLGARATYTFEPQAESHGPSGPVTRWKFVATKERLGVRYVDVQGTVHVRSRFDPEEIEGDAGSIEATRWWPADDERVQAVARKLTAARATIRERVLGILSYVHRGLNYRGQVGSRYGVRQVMEQGFGHCWDKSDVFITLCRAAGIPARQWAGWVPAMNSGHVWAEVHLAGEGWIPVDATTPWLGTSHHYVPMFRSDDGDMPIVYVRWPQVTLPK